MEAKLEKFETNWKVLHKLITVLLKDLQNKKLLSTLPKNPNGPIDFQLKYFSYRLRGHIFMEFRQFKKAYKYYRKAKKQCENH